MVYTLSSRRLTSILSIVFFFVVGVVTASPAMAQDAGGRFRVLIPNLEVEGGVRDRFGRDVANETKKLIDEMVTHRPIEKGDLNQLLRQFNLKEKDLDCVTSQQLAIQGGIEVVMCGTIRPSDGGNETVAYFVTRDQARFDVAPFVGNDAKAVAQHIYNSFQTFVDQLSLVTRCNEDLQSQQWEEALDKCDRALQLNPSSQPAMFGKGYALMQLDRFEEALTTLQQLLAENPIHTEGLQAAGFVAARADRVEESRAYYNQYLELNPGNVQIRRTIARDALRAGDPEGALTIVEQGMTSGADDPQLVEYAGYFAAAAAAQADAAANANGEDAEAKAVARGFWEKALGYLEQIYAERGDDAPVDVVVQLVNAMSQLDRVDEAVDLGAKAVASKEGHATLWQAYAFALYTAGRTADAVAAIDSAAAIDPETPGLRAQQAQWLMQAEMFEEAGAAYRKAVEAGELESETVGMTIFAVGVSDKFQKGDHAGAEPYFELALQFVTKPESRGMINFFSGVALFHRGVEVGEPGTARTSRQALPLFERALEFFKQSDAYAQSSEANAKNVSDYLNNTEAMIGYHQQVIRSGQ